MNLSKKSPLGRQTPGSGSRLYGPGGIPGIFLPGRPEGRHAPDQVHRHVGTTAHGKNPDFQTGGEPAVFRTGPRGSGCRRSESV